MRISRELVELRKALELERLVNRALELALKVAQSKLEKTEKAWALLGEKNALFSLRIALMESELLRFAGTIREFLKTSPIEGRKRKK